MFLNVNHRVFTALALEPFLYVDFSLELKIHLRQRFKRNKQQQQKKGVCLCVCACVHVGTQTLVYRCGLHPDPALTPMKL